MKSVDYQQFFSSQLALWPEVEANYAALEKAPRRQVEAGGVRVILRFNPGRIRSSAAAIDKASIAARPCFLCRANRPVRQLSADLGEYELLVNPYPIFSRHFTIPSKLHQPQSIAGRVEDMLELAQVMPGMVIFYNAPASGASAPDHLHFQAVPANELPLFGCLDAGTEWPLCQTIVTEGSDMAHVAGLTEGRLLSLSSAGEEPEINLYARLSREGVYQTVIIPRKAHRPSNYGASEGQILISPASAEMAGVIVAPRREDFDYIADSERIARLFDECGYRKDEAVGVRRQLSVGIVRAPELKVEFHGRFAFSESAIDSNTKCLSLRLTADGKIDAGDCVVESLLAEPTDGDDSFTLSDVMIGIGFHWQQHEDQSFHGALLVRSDGDALQAVNVVDIETYLRSVVSSEMNAAAPEEFLKAHAVISRSWVLAQIMPPAHLDDHRMIETESERIKWYDRDAHTGFDICADDHCQRYQGCTKASTPQVESALEATEGEVLAYGNELCDARFSKCCGGISELFSSCWQPTDLPYLQAVDDPFCGRATPELLTQVLNGYDRSTTDYYRWRVDYTAAELADIVRHRSGIDFGEIVALRPLHRGPSGRIDRLEICGTKRRMVIGKELEIRRTLSESHLYSSAFTAESFEPDCRGVPARWTLSGLGWGHGVGLCQIGAAQMAAEGYDYRSILRFYFPGARLVRLY